MPRLRTCATCGRESYKGTKDLRFFYGWRFKLIAEQEIATCGSCNRESERLAGHHYPFRRHSRRVAALPIE